MTKEQDKLLLQYLEDEKFYKRAEGIAFFLFIICIVLSSFVLSRYIETDYDIARKSLIRIIGFSEIILFSIGYSAIIAIRRLIMTKKSNQWIQTNCLILKRSSDTLKNSRYRVAYIPKIYYLYTVEGNDYISHRFNYKKFWFTTERKVFQLIQNYEVGKNYSCYYNPSNPTQAILEKDIPLDAS